MKKIIYTILIIGLLTTATHAYALTTVSLTPVSIKVDEGDRFKVDISIDPAGVVNYTAKIALQFPSNLLQIESFRFNENWMPLNQPGYALIDNDNGALIRTGGYPGGISSKVAFGAVTFRAKKSGSGTIKISGDSLILDAQNQNIIDTRPVQVSVIIEALTPLTLPDEIPPGYLFKESMKRGDESIDVAYLQLCLKIAGVFEEDVNGYFGPATEKAVSGFSGAKIVDSQTREKLNALCAASLEVIPEQLFDINLEIDDATISDIKELSARVVFVSFGKVPTPVDLTFIIEDEFGNSVYIDEGEEVDIVVETEAVKHKKFEGIELPPGKYTLILRTLYNVSVFDEFRQSFEITEEEKIPFWKSWLFLLIIALVIIIIVYAIYAKNREKEENKN